MDSLPYVDTLIKEYLLFRGFTAALHAFNADLAADRGCGFQADQICNMVFKKLIAQSRGKELMDTLEFLSARLYCRLAPSYDAIIRKLEVSLIRCYLVHAVKAQRMDAVRAFFADYGDQLMAGPEAPDWAPWFALPYVAAPAAHPALAAFFGAEWGALTEAAFRNFLAEVMQQLPLPAILRFNADRQRRAELGRENVQLARENARLRQVLEQGGSSLAEKLSWAMEGSLVDAEHASARAPSSPAGIASPPGEVLRSNAAPASAHKNAGTGKVGELKKPKPVQGREVALETPQKSSAGEQPVRDNGALRHNHAEAEKQVARHSRDLSFQEWSPASNGSAPSSREAPSPQDLGEVGHSGRTERVGEGSVLLQPGAAKQAATPPALLPRPAQQEPDLSTPASSAGHRPGRPPEAAEGGHAGDGAPREGALPKGRRLWTEQEDRRDIVVQAEQLDGHEAPVVAAAFSPGGQNAATADSDGVVRIWAPEGLAADGSRAAVLLCGAPVTALAWDARADKVMLVGTAGKGVKAWHADSKRMVSHVRLDPAFPDATSLPVMLVGTAGKGVKAWHADTKRMVSHVRLDPAFPDVASLACSPAEPTFACASCSPAGPGGAPGAAPAGRLSLWNLRTFKRIAAFAVPGGDPALASLAFSGDGRMLLAAGADGRARIFDAGDRAQVAVWEVDKPGAAAHVRFCGADGRSLIALTGSGSVQWWDTALLKEPVRTVDAAAYCGAHGSRARQSFAVSSASSALVLTSVTCQVPVLCQAADGDWRFELAVSHRQPVTAVDWHPTLNAVISGSADHSVWLTCLDL